MKALLNATQKFWEDESGVTAIEYGLIASLIAVGIILAVTAVGGNLATVFNDIADKLAPATTPSTS
jgi:pilus assembly protein Flp/PilA